MRYLPVLGILVVAAALRAPAFFQPPWYLDEGIFASVAEVWRGGGALYVDAWDNKPPGIFAVYAAGWTTGLDMVAVRLLDLGAMLGVIVLVWAIARRAAGEASAVVAAAVTGALLGLPIIEGHIASTESFLILFTTLGMYLVLRAVEPGRPAVAVATAGVAFGAALLFKQIAVFDVLAAAAFLTMVHRYDLGRILPFGAGLCALPAVVGLAFLLAGHFNDLWFATVASLAGYREDSGATGLERYLVALMPMALAVPYALWLRPWQTRSAEALLVLWLAFTAIGVSASGRAYPHYLIQMTPAFALVAGLAVSHYRPRRPRTSVAFGLFGASLVLTHVILGPLPNLAWNREPTYTRDYYRNFLDYATGDADRDAYDAFFDSRAYAHLGLYDELEEAGLAGETVFVWGDVPWLYAEGGLQNPTRYTTLMNALQVEGTASAVATLLLQRGPDYIIVMEERRASWEEVQPLLDVLYSPAREMLWAVLYAREPSTPLE